MEVAFNLFNRFYYGKAGQADYTPDKLPANRRALFFEMLKIRFSGLFGVNLLYLLFCLPGMVWTILNAIAIMTQETTDISTISGLITTYLIGMILCLAIAGIGAPGEMYILRNWARDQHSFVLSDFKDALKGNWKYGLLTGAINGVSLLLLYICYMFYGQLVSDNLFFIVPQMLSVTVCLVWWMINMLIFPMMVTYDLKYKGLIRNCAIMVIARLPWSFLFLLLTAGVPAFLVFFFSNYSVIYTMLGAILYYVLIGFSLTGFIYASYANSCFDKFLNPNIDGAEVGRGLRKESDDEDLENVEDPNPLI